MISNELCDWGGDNLRITNVSGKVVAIRDTNCMYTNGGIMAEKKKMGRPATGETPLMGLRLSPQQRTLAMQVAKNAGKRPAVSTGLKILLAQYAASQAANK